VATHAAQELAYGRMNTPSSTDPHTVYHH